MANKKTNNNKKISKKEEVKVEKVKKKENNHIINKRMPFYLTYNTNTINSISILNNNMFTKAEY